MMQTFHEVRDDDEREMLAELDRVSDRMPMPAAPISTASASALLSSASLSDAALRAIPMLASIPSLLSGSLGGTTVSTAAATSASSTTSATAPVKSSLPSLLDSTISLQSLLYSNPLTLSGSATQLPQGPPAAAAAAHLGVIDLTKPPVSTMPPAALPPTNVPPPMFTVPPPTFNVPPPAISDTQEIMLLAKMELHKKELTKVSSIPDLIQYSKFWMVGLEVSARGGV